MYQVDMDPSKGFTSLSALHFHLPPPPLDPMDPFIHAFAIMDAEAEEERQRTAWSGRALLRRLRKRMSTGTMKDDRVVELKEEVGATPRKIVLPSSASLAVVERRKAPRPEKVERPPSRGRLLTRERRRQLSVIEEIADDVEESEVLEPDSSTCMSSPDLPSRTSLLGLPRELRDMIFEHVFSDWTSSSLSLLQTCRQIHDEGRKPAYQRSLFRIHNEHWPDHDFFQARYIAAMPREAVSSIQHLALRLPRGEPYDCYPSRHLHVDFAALGLRLRTLIIYSHLPRPLPNISDYGGVIEPNFCLWLKQTLYSMPSLDHICILNYESQTPALYDMPSPRLVRMVRSSIFRDVMAEYESEQPDFKSPQASPTHTLTERDFQWRCLTTDSLESSMSNCTNDEKVYHVYASKLNRAVQVAFQSDIYAAQYGLEEALERPQAKSEKLLKDGTLHPDLNCSAYAGFLAKKIPSHRRRKHLYHGGPVRAKNRREGLDGERPNLMNERPGSASGMRKRLSRTFGLRGA